jgi:hypothetical protein
MMARNIVGKCAVGSCQGEITKGIENMNVKSNHFLELIL